MNWGIDMSQIFNKEDYAEGQHDFRVEISDYLLTLADLVTEEDAENLPRFLKVLANRIRCCEVP